MSFRSKPKPDSRFTNRPSDRIDHRQTASPFSKSHPLVGGVRRDQNGSSKKNNSRNNNSSNAFVSAYKKGQIPCHINHGGVKHSLTWKRQPRDLDYCPLLTNIADGLSETRHPYVFLARTAFREMLDACPEKVIPLTRQLVMPLRKALSSKSKDVVLATLLAIQHLSNVVQKELNPHLSSLLILIAKRFFHNDFREEVSNTLSVLSSNGGSKAVQQIKRKVPTFTAF